MPGEYTALLIVFATVIGLFLIWLFLIAPRPRKKAVAPFCRSYAHRGLWGDGIPENSLAAFAKAAEQGFAIELDVQLSCDGEVFVFHDYTLSRMCGREETLSSLPAATLKEITLKNTDERIPTFREVLDLVAGRVPLLVELKGESTNTALCPAVAALLDAYEGTYCVESFNPMLLRWFKKNRPRVVRGFLMTHLIKEKKKGSPALNFALSALLLNCLCRPAFLAWDQKYPRMLARRTCTGLLGAASFVFTVHSETDCKDFLGRDIYPIFDGFTPSSELK